MTYSEAIQFLYDLQLFGSKLGLENPRRLAALAGNPHERLRFIHVAGTNGKGSTCAMLEAIYRAAGLKVGLFTSPHLVAFGERIQVNRTSISDADVSRLVEKIRGLLHLFSPEAHPTFFEVVTVMALSYFAEQRVDVVIWETGLGGRLDATNIVTPLASVITNIQLDHQQWLGDTLEQIATEKGGIIKPGVPILTAVDDGPALAVLREIAQKNAAPFRQVHLSDPDLLRVLPAQLPLAGEHQRLNAALAVATVRQVASKIRVNEAAFAQGLATVDWPGRLQLIEPGPGRKILLDGAHNVGSTDTLRAALPALAGHQPVTLILGIMRDKDWQPMCRMLVRDCARVLLVPVKSKRTADAADLARACHEGNPRAEVRACASLSEALAAAARDPFVVITGSLYLVGEAMELLGLSTAAGADEHLLNEWSADHQPTQPAHVAR